MHQYNYKILLVCKSYTIEIELQYIWKCYDFTFELRCTIFGYSNTVFILRIHRTQKHSIPVFPHQYMLQLRYFFFFWQNSQSKSTVNYITSNHNAPVTGDGITSHNALYTILITGPFLY